MTAVWASTLAGPEKLVALALADWANDDGGSIRPSIATVAKKTSSSESQARRTIRKLETSGILSIEANPNGGAPGSTRHYRMHVDRLPTTGTDATPRMDATPSVYATPRTDATPRVDARDGSHGCAETGGVDATRSVSRTVMNHQESRLGSDAGPETESPTVPDASANAGNAKRKRQGAKLTIQGWIRQLDEDDQAIPDTDEVWAYAEQIGLPREFITLAWREFLRSSRESGKQQKNWRQTFRNYVRGNWLKLWWRDTSSGTWSLSTAGQQARAYFAARESRALSRCGQ